MPEIKSEVPTSVLEQWMEDNNLSVANNVQLCAKLYDLEQYCKALDARLTALDKDGQPTEVYLDNPTE